MLKIVLKIVLQIFGAIPKGADVAVNVDSTLFDIPYFCGTWGGAPRESPFWLVLSLLAYLQKNWYKFDKWFSLNSTKSMFSSSRLPSLPQDKYNLCCSPSRNL